MPTFLVHPVIQMDDKTKYFDVYFIKDQEVVHAKVPCRIHLTVKRPELTLLHSHITGKKYLLNSEDVVETYADLHELNERGGNVGSNYRDCVTDTNTTRRNAQRANIILQSELMSGGVKLTISPCPPNIQSSASTTTTRGSASSSLSAAGTKARRAATSQNTKQISEVTKTAKILAKLAIKQGKEHDKQLSAQRNEFTQKLSAQGNEIGRELRDATNQPRRRRSL